MTRKQSGVSIMMRLIGLVKPLLPIMLLAILLGVVGYLCAILLTVLAGCGLLGGMHLAEGLRGIPQLFASLAPQQVFALLVVFAVARGLLHYGEQYCNHYIAFRLLAIIRHRVFAALRRLCPAKLEGRGKGDLIALITSDIELLEVFYAHTISPVAIALLVSAIMTVTIWQQYLFAGLLALAAYVTVGAVIPLALGGRGAHDSLRFRNAFGDMNSFMLESLRGLDETIQYGAGERRLASIGGRSRELGGLLKPLNKLEQTQRSVTNAAVLLFSLAMLVLMLHAYRGGLCSFAAMLIATIAMMGSFGPVIALANLSSTLQQTLAAGERVLDLLDEQPQTEEVTEGVAPVFDGAQVDGVGFSYLEEPILKNYSMTVEQGKITGIHGASGSGKSTLLKLLMRFWDVDSGVVRISGEDVRTIRTSALRDMESYVTQETSIFHDSIANNIAIGKPGATREEIVSAAKKAALHDFIQTLPQGYDTMAGELGDTLSGGERQRIGVARAFLHDAPFVLLDEPTSNLDSLNEGIILKSLDETRENRTVLLVSHRKSTLGICDSIFEMENGRVS